MHFISGTVEGNDARQSCGRVTNLNAHRFLFGHIIVMAHNCSWKMSSLRWLMSYLTHWDQCPRPYQQQIGYFESQRKALQLVLSQHWVKPLDRGIYHYYFMIMDFEAVERVQLGHSKEMNGWHQMLVKASRENLTGHCEVQTLLSYYILPRIALSVNVPLPIWRSNRTDIPSCPCWQIWLQGCDYLFRWHRYFL